jgi:hypothetical protein
LDLIRVVSSSNGLSYVACAHQITRSVSWIVAIRVTLRVAITIRSTAFEAA